MKKIIILFTILILLFLSRYLTSKFFNKTVSTQIITYTPEDREHPTKSGECNQISTATQGRPNTYRCSVDNEIYDPCFKVESGKIVCDLNPKVSGDEFELTTTTKLPENNTNYNESKRFDWIYELEDGTMCFLIQGTAGTTNSGEPYYYSCEENKVIVGDVDTSSQLWSAQIGKILQNSENQAEHLNKVNILRVWD